MGKPYVKLDLDWRKDPKVRELRERHGLKGELAWVNMMCVFGRIEGAFDTKDPEHMAIARDAMRTSDEKVLLFCSWFAECGLIDPAVYARDGRASSARAAREQRARKGRAAHMASKGQ